MEKTPTSQTPQIYKAINDIMQGIEAVTKAKTNAQQGYKFRGIDDMYNAIHPLFKKNSVFITSNIVSSKREERQTKAGGALIYTISLCEFKFYTTDGSFVTSIIEGEAMDSGDKSTNKAMSAALKYALMQMFLIPTEELKDADTATHEIAPKTQETAQKNDISAATGNGAAKPSAQVTGQKRAKKQQSDVITPAAGEPTDVDILVCNEYSTEEDIVLVLGMCESVAQLNTLYHSNVKLASEINIRSQFTKRKDEITTNN